MMAVKRNFDGKETEETIGKEAKENTRKDRERKSKTTERRVAWQI